MCAIYCMSITLQKKKFKNIKMKHRNNLRLYHFILYIFAYSLATFKSEQL